MESYQKARFIHLKVSLSRCGSATDLKNVYNVYEMAIATTNGD